MVLSTLPIVTRTSTFRDGLLREVRLSSMITLVLRKRTGASIGLLMLKLAAAQLLMLIFTYLLPAHGIILLKLSIQQLTVAPTSASQT